jgi:hypothetical protein
MEVLIAFIRYMLAFVSYLKLLTPGQRQLVTSNYVYTATAVETRFCTLHGQRHVRLSPLQ